MKLNTLKLAAVLALGVIGLPAQAQEPAAAPAATPATAKTLDELLEQVRTADARDAKANADREARFAAARDQQGKLLADANAEKTALENQAAALAKQFENNDSQIGELTKARDIKAGNLGELFGVMRQTAGDFATVARNSMLTAQFPDRVSQIDRLAQTKTMPPMEDLNRFWFEMQREMTEGGKISRIQAKVTAPDGSQADKTVLRVGPFVAVSEGQFLEYTSGAGAFSTPPKQPPGKFGDVAEDFEKEGSGYHAMIVDPTRGVLLSLFSQRPSLVDRVVEGEAVGYIIIGLGLIGSLIAIFQFGYLTATNAKVNRQLGNLNNLSADNPLGRVLMAFRGKNAPSTGEEAEVVELRISEAVLKELPPLERGQSFLKLAVAAGPLLGLVGTVVGMIHTFQVITESGSGDPKLMAAGISMAMIATLLGLGIAIPLLFANSALQSRSKRITQILDEQSTGLLAELIEKRTHA
ncbi:MotA/TolQ/ExbB proton channel family protein [Solimonas sp. K1W22B-7]|uniref:MotA/TolQ/ExbB proton channel family protein n=1 Tax=Solimonas sp. K1W22B-7 TaxID=2303331 RepID=UPI000E32EABC|nr:MotA/TolQ/ExbB proton channel family protein [Solimonas sp. K1W22B-7]AXQ28489.1 MotA/TolQ/ExbB proton channel family protein [Solimonas sp. K1W22B-7]